MSVTRTYKTAFGVYLNSKITQVVFLDITNMQLSNVPVHFKKLSVIVYDGFYKKEVAIDLFRYLSEMQGSSLTIQQWLDSKNNVNLVTSDKFPKGEYCHVTYTDIQYKNFGLYPGNADKSAEDQDSLTVHNARDIRVGKVDGDNPDLTKLRQCCLWTVNGHLVNAVNSDDYIYLLGGGKHFRVNDNLHVGCLNFNGVTTLSTMAIDKEQITLDKTSGYPKIHIRLEEDVLDRRVWMSLGGRFLFDGIVNKSAERVITLDLQNYDLVNRIFESNNYIDLNEVLDKELRVINKDYYWDDEVIANLLTHVSTFLILVDNPFVNVEVVPMITYNYPFTYMTKETTKFPMLLSNGLIPKYFTRKLGNKRLLDICLGNNPNYLNETTGVGYGLDVYHNVTDEANPAKINNGYFLKIKAMVE